MIRNIRLKNFVHFEDEQILNFDNGSYFFIGQNESGKSCMFEAIRRCMSTSKSMGMSSSHIAETGSIVTCDFELSDTEQAKSGLLRIPKNTRQDRPIDVFVKFVFKVNSQSKQYKLLVDLVKEVPGSWAVNKEVKIPDATFDNFHEFLSDETFRLSKAISLEHLCVCLKRAVEHDLQECSTETWNYNDKTACEDFLVRHVDSAVLIIYPTRAIATGQWTKSAGFQIQSRQVKRDKIETAIAQKSEIMSWYFGLGSDKITTEEREDVRDYFRTMTNNNSFTFSCEDNTIKVQETNLSEKHQLIKVPDGYFEAKQIAILLAFKQHKTICIEEAGKGMHPQMMERLRDLVLKPINDKVVITTSHSPSMLSFWNIPRIFFFRKIRDRQNEDKVTFTVIDGSSILPEKEHKTSRMVTTHSFSSIFFARRVLYVEGDGDCLFMSVLKQKLLDDEDFIPTMLRNVDMDRKTFNKFIYSLQIIPMHGELNKHRYRQVSKALKLKHFFVLDYDATEDVQKARHHMEGTHENQMEQQQEDRQEITFNKFLREFELTHLTNEKIRQDIQCLEKEGIFVWHKNQQQVGEIRKRGTLESALITLVDENKAMDLKPIFEENYVKLQWDPKLETKGSKHKFASNKKLTIGNVEEIIKVVLDCCLNGKGVDFLRLVEFLIRSSK